MRNCNKRVEKSWAGGGSAVPTHVHLTSYDDLVEFLQKFHFCQAAIEEGKYTQQLKNVFSATLYVLNSHLEDPLQKAIFEDKETERHFRELDIRAFIGEIFVANLYVNLLMREGEKVDSGFLIVCRKLQFVGLRNFERMKNASIIEKSMQPVIANMREISKRLSMREKMREIVDQMSLIVQIVRTVNEKIIGSDELVPLFIYCLIQSRNEKFMTSKFMISCFMDEDDVKGESGFILTQIETATKKIDYFYADKNNNNFARQILESEIERGEHLLRRREIVEPMPLKFEGEFKFFY